MTENCSLLSCASAGSQIWAVVFCLVVLTAGGITPYCSAFLVERPPLGTAVARTPRSIAVASHPDNKHYPPDFSIQDDEGSSEASAKRMYRPLDVSIWDDDDELAHDTTFTPHEFTVVEEDENNKSARRPKTNTASKHLDKSIRSRSAVDDDGATTTTTTSSSPSKPPPRTRNMERQPPSADGRASWMQRNSAFLNKADKANDVVAKGRAARPSSSRPSERDNRRGHGRGTDLPSSSSPSWSGARTFRQDFHGTRVFVQNLPPDATWQDVKDHFRVAGQVIFASVSVEPETGQSKGCGVVQFDTTEMAREAIEIMRDHPLNGYQLYVREDVKVNDSGSELGTNTPKGKKGPTPPSKWKCANEDNVVLLSDDEIKSIRSLIKARDDARRRRQFDASDAMRDELMSQYNVHVDDRLKMWWTAMDGNNQVVPKTIRDIKGDGRWGDRKTQWRQIPTTPENDACVNPDMVHGLLEQRDIARREKDFATADALLEQARTSPDNDLTLRIHDESRTWRIWTETVPPRPVVHDTKSSSPADQCLELVKEYAPEKLADMELLLKTFPGREYNILKKLKQRYK